MGRFLENYTEMKGSIVATFILIGLISCVATLDTQQRDLQAPVAPKVAVPAAPVKPAPAAPKAKTVVTTTTTTTKIGGSLTQVLSTAMSSILSFLKQQIMNFKKASISVKNYRVSLNNAKKAKDSKNIVRLTKKVHMAKKEVAHAHRLKNVARVYNTMFKVAKASAPKVKGAKATKYSMRVKSLAKRFGTQKNAEIKRAKAMNSLQIDSVNLKKAQAAKNQATINTIKVNMKKHKMILKRAQLKAKHIRRKSIRSALRISKRLRLKIGKKTMKLAYRPSKYNKKVKRSCKFCKQNINITHGHKKLMVIKSKKNLKVYPNKSMSHKALKMMRLRKNVLKKKMKANKKFKGTLKRVKNLGKTVIQHLSKKIVLCHLGITRMMHLLKVSSKPKKVIISRKITTMKTQAAKDEKKVADMKRKAKIIATKIIKKHKIAKKVVSLKRKLKKAKPSMKLTIKRHLFAAKKAMKFHMKIVKHMIKKVIIIRRITIVHIHVIKMTIKSTRRIYKLKVKHQKIKAAMKKAKGPIKARLAHKLRKNKLHIKKSAK